MLYMANLMMIGLDCWPFLSLPIRWLPSISTSIWAFLVKAHSRFPSQQHRYLHSYLPSHPAPKYSFYWSVALACRLLYLNHQFFYPSFLSFLPVHWFSPLAFISRQFVKLFIAKFYRFNKVSKLTFTFDLVILWHLIHFPGFFYFSLNIFHTIENMWTLRWLHTFSKNI